MLKLLRKARYFLKYNKKGFSLIEAIAVTTIMAILAVLIGSLLSSSTNFYNSNKEQAAAKDISKIVEKEIVKLIEGA
ncbi:MAG: type II secretion system protein, partial [Clostridia bacterium]